MASMNVSVEEIRTNSFRVRTSFDPDKLEDLKNSIRKRGILSPIVVRRRDGYYELIAGERRLLAAKALGLETVPAIVREASADDALLEMGVENIQREDLSAYEKGRWVAKMKERNWPVTSIAEQTGKPARDLWDWLQVFEEAERLQKSALVAHSFDPQRLPQKSFQHTFRAPIPDDKKAEFAAELAKPNPPTAPVIQRATRLVEQEPSLTAREAIDRARGINILVSIPEALMGKLKAQGDRWNLSLQDTILRILGEYLG